LQSSTALTDSAASAASIQSTTATDSVEIDSNLPTETQSEWWWWLVIALAGACVCLLIVALVVRIGRRRRRNARPVDEASVDSVAHQADELNEPVASASPAKSSIYASASILPDGNDVVYDTAFGADKPTANYTSMPTIDEYNMAKV
jgi:flagellar biosynthesis/type III secretory pathway M-ring protein FliF/YscJ